MRGPCGKVKNLGKLGLREIEGRLKLLGLQLRPRSQPRGEIMTSSAQENEQQVEELDKIVTAFSEVQPALRRLWRAVEAKGYTTQNWQDWQAVDAAVRRYARATAEHTGIDQREIDKRITAGDREPFLRSNVGADLGEAEADRSSDEQPAPGDEFAWERGFVTALAVTHLMNHDLQAVAYALKQAV